MWSEKTIKKHRNQLIDRLEKWDEQTVDIYNNPDAMSYSVKHVEVYSDVCLLNAILGYDRFDFDKRTVEE